MSREVVRDIDSRKLSRWYDFQARLYAAWRDDHDDPVVEFLAQRLRRRGDRARLLDAGCGTGLFSIGLALRLQGWELVGVDASRGMIEVARTKAARAGVDQVAFRQGDAGALDDPDHSYDVVVAAGLFPNVPRARPVLREFRRVLRPDGLLIVVEIDRRAVTGRLRLLFRTLIFGQRVISAILPRFRFAPRWNIETSTVDPDGFATEIEHAGFRVSERMDIRPHTVYACDRSA